MNASSRELDTIQLRSMRKGMFTFLERRIQELSGQNREAKEREASQIMRLYPYNYYVVGVPKRYYKSRHDLCSGGQFLLLLYKSLLQNSSITNSRKIIVLFKWSLVKDSRMVLIFLSMPHGTVRKKYQEVEI